ncbi:hypothetical protein [Azospirillum sp. TSO22-1]|uniref:hypothetical protein n=1 Tax=Azospirillum sp. TSO22-1 TaxID=716789 RepID=UPI000D620A6A|nr:hypothetical protein [Azospirillum sp. TSO22-1]PWC52588.1 hypothetical protein TSO221_13620 [Azospirillum sp. TSO22-1]
MYTALVAAPLALAAAPHAHAQQQAQPQTQAPPAGKQQVRMAKGSPTAKVFFGEPAQLLDDDGTYADAMKRVAKDLSQSCGTIESFGWEYNETDLSERQQHANKVFDSTMQAFVQAGYKLVERKVRAIPDPETVVFTAESKAKKLIMLWSPTGDATLLLLCDASAGKTPPTKK